jgi:hypothetical protein
MKNQKTKLSMSGDLTSARSYPGQTEGDRVARYLNDLPRARAKQHPFLKSLSVLRELAEAVKGSNETAIDRLLKRRRGVNFAYNWLVDAAKPTRLRDLDLKRHKDGLILQPTTPKGQAAVAVIVLDQKGRADRIRKCLHCGTWFYARFKHQQFCNDPVRKCQWNHYHSDEWRKQHRERNRKYQAAYREPVR